VLLLISAATVNMTVAAPNALAAGTTLFNQPFHDNTVDGPAGSLSLPTAPSGTNSACLSASGNATKNPLASCSSSTDSQGSGKLRFTSATTNLEGGVFASTSIPTSQGLDVTFNSYQYGGTGADGLAFVLAGADPASPAIPASIGQPGGSLGYSLSSSGQSGLSHGYLGIGFDTFGNFSNKFEGTGCTDPSNIAQSMPGQVVVRGPGNGGVGYCPLQSSAATATSKQLTLRATTRAASVVPVEVVFNPTSSTVTTASGLAVPAGDYDVTFTPVGGTVRSLVGALPVVPSGLYPSSWVNTNGIPKQLVFGWVGSTGSVTDFHEVDNVVVTSINPVPVLAVSETSYAASSLGKGSPVTYTVAASSSGATENQPVTVTETLPAGVLPVSASGTGWVCGAPSGQQISCTSSTTPFTSGTITVNGVVTSASVTAAIIQSSSTAAVSSGDASPATDTSTTAGTVPSAPSLTSISPTNGAAGGNNDVTLTGTGLSTATAIEIGTSSEFQAGTPTVLVPCAAAGTGCFTITSGTSLDLAHMAGHAAGAVTVKVVTLGTSASISYTYNTGPALLFAAPPGGEAGVAYSDQLTVTGGTSPFTWSVSSGTLPPGLTLGASTGLLAGTPTTGGTYNFTVKVTDSAALSDSSAVTLTIIPGPSLSFPTPPSGWTHTVYSSTLTVSGGTSPYAWSVSAGSLPAGITLNASGVLAGTPTATGTFSFTARATDANGQIATEATTLTIAAGVSTTFSAPPAGQVGIAYSTSLTATGGTTPYAWSVNSGTLPAGLTLSAAGVLSGTPTTAGSSTFTVNVIDANNGVATASITLVINSAGLSLTVSANTSAVAAGGKVNYTVTAVNVGSVAYTGATFTASLAGTLDDATYNADAAATTGTVTFTSPNLTWTGNLAIGATATVTYSVTAKNPDPGDGTLTTSVVSTTTGNNCKAGNTDAHCSVTVTESALTIAQTADVSSAPPGGTVHYTITVTNTGQSPYTGATFTDPLTGVLDDAAYGNNAAATAGTVTFSSPNLTWTGDLAVGAAVTITYSVQVSNPDSGNGTLASTITSATAGNNCPSGGTDSRCTTTVTVSGLTITNTASASSPTPGSTVRYTITVTNSGQTAFTGAAISDSLSGVLDDASYNGDAAATVGAVSVASPNLTWTGNLAAGASATITFSVTIASPDTGDKTLTAVVTSATPGSNCPSGGTDSRCTATVTVLTPGLTITKTADVSTTLPGSVVHYTITVADTGQTPYTGATFADSLSGVLGDATYDGNASATSGTVSYISPVLTWTGNLAVGGTATVTYSVTVSNPDTGDKNLVNTVVSTTPGSNCAAGSTDPRCTAAVTDLVPGLSVTQTADATTAAPGQVVHYTVTVTDSGQTPYTGATFTDPLSGVLDDAAYNSDASATSGTVSFASPSLTWTGNLAVGGTATITFSVTVSSPDTGNHVLASTLTSATTGSTCPSGSPGAGCALSIGVAQLTIVNQASAATTVPGGVVRYTATFTNAGQVAYNGITVVTDATNVFDDAVANGDETASSGTLTVGTTGLSWTGNIAVGGTVTITGTVTVNNPDTGNQVLAATLVSAAPGSSCPSGSSNPACSTSVTVLTPALTITKTANVTATVPGGTVGYTITVTNTGQTPYTGATVTDSLAGIAGDAVYNGDAAATAGSVSFTSPVLTWTGNLAVGATAVITYTLAVDDPDTDGKVIVNSVSSTDAGSTCPPGSASTACVVKVMVLTPALSVSQSADPATAVPGQVVHYTVTVTDTGQTPYTGAAFTDPLAGVLDDATYNSDAAATAGSVSFASPSLTWTGNLAVGATATVTFSVTVSNPDTGNHVLASTLSSAASGSTCPPGSPGAACALSVGVAQLMIASSANVATTVPGGVVRFTGTFTNTGQVAYDAITISTSGTDIFDDAAPNGDQTATSGTLSVSEATGVTWTGDIPAGGTVTITGTVTVSNPDTGNQVLASTLASSAPGSNCPAASTDPACTSTVTVLTPALTITKTASTTATVPGGTVGYTITVANTGQTPYTGATVADSFAQIADDGTYDGDAAATAGSVSFTSPVLTWTGDLAVGATAVITYTVTANTPDTGDKQLINSVSSAAPGSTCPPGSTATACRVTVAVLTPALGITKTADVSAAVPGQVVHYTITVTNTGQVPYTGATFTDSLSAALDEAAYNSDAAATSGTVTFTSPVLAWTGDLAPGASATVTYSVTINNPETGDLVLDNTVTSTTAGSNCPAGSADPDCTATVVVVDASTLTITKTTDVASAAAGGVVHYTVTVANSGLTVFAGASFSDALSGVLDDAAYNNDATATAGTVTFTSPALTWAGNVPASGSVTITYSVTVSSPDTGNQIMANTVTSTSPDSNCASGSTDPRCTATVTVSSLAIDFTASASTATPGGTVGFVATLTNTGQTPYFGISVATDATGIADDAASNGNETASSGTLSLGTTGAVWTGDIPVGGTVTVSSSVTVNNPDTGDHLLTATAVSAAPGNNCPSGGTDPACTVSVTVLTPGLTIVKTANTTSTVPGATVGYTITVTNTGQTPYTGATVTDSLAGIEGDAVYNGDASATAGSVSFTSPVLTWTGDLAVGASAVITYTLAVDDPDTDGKIIVNRASSTDPGSTCPPDSVSTACLVTVVVLTQALDIVTSADASTAVPGQVVHYTVTVDDTGQTPYTGATFTDPLSGVLDDAAYDSDAAASTGTVSFASPVLSWTGNLSPGGVATVTFSVTVSSPDTGDRILASTIGSTTPGGNCASGSTDLDCTATVDVAQLMIASSANVATTVPGGVVRFTGTFTNTGQVAYDAITISTSGTDIFDDAAPNGDQTATSGTLSVSEATGVTWTGDIPAGGTVTITGTVTVSNPDTGNQVLASTLASSAPGSNCPSGSTDPSCTSTVTVLTPALTVTKTVDTTVTVPGGTVGYTVTVTNSGQTPYTGATVTDSLAGIAGDASYDGDAAATAGSVSFTSPVLTWTGDLAVGASAVITYTITVDDPDTGDKVIVNSVSSVNAGSTCPPGSTATDCRVTVVVLTPALGITQAPGTSTAVPGQVVTYTVTVTDTGQTPYTGATFTDPLPGVLDDATYNNDATTTMGTITFTSPDLTWTGNLTVGGTATITYSITVASPDTGNHVLASTLTSTTTGNNCPTGSTDPGCTATVDVAELTIDNTADVATTQPGGVVRYTIVASNTGQAPITSATYGASFLGVGDDATYNSDAATTAGTLDLDTTTGTITWSGDLAPGASATVTGSVTINDPDTGDKILTETVTSATPGSNCPDGSTDPRCTSTVTVLTPALTITKAANVTTTTPGSAVDYTVTIANTGQTPYTGATVADDLSAVVGEAAYNADATATTGAVSYTSPTLTWTGDLAVGQTATVTYSITISDPDTGDRLLVNTVSSAADGSTCPPGSTDPACTVTVQDLIPALAITKTADTTTSVPGGVVGYTITVTDTGETPYTGATVTDALNGVLDDAAYNGDATATAGSVSFTSPALTWTGDLAVGASVTITYTITVDTPDAGDKTLANTATSTDAGSTCPPADPVTACSATVTVLTPALSISKTADASQVVAGQAVSYSIVVDNTGEVEYPAATISDPLSGVLSGASYNADATATVGAVSFASGVLSWTGDLPVNATAVISYSVTTNSADTSGTTLTNTVSSPVQGSNCGSASTDPGCTATVTVLPQAIDLSSLTSSFTLSGPPGTIAEQNAAVTMLVTSNSPDGYQVTVQPDSQDLTAPGLTDTIPSSDLDVRGAATDTFLPLTGPVIVQNQDGPSAPDGDLIVNDYQITIPDVRSGAYQGTLDYIATATP
jgi:uncharacterized repeat protein (TIGR01451 family)